MSIAIEVMMDEHQYILRALKTARQMCKQVMEKGKVETEDFYKFIDFVRNFADKYHHGKEEVILFRLMEAEIGQMAVEGPIRGMLVEHDLGRLYMSRLEKALEDYKEGNKDTMLDIIANTISYTHLLNQHINTEDKTLYPFAQRRLSKTSLKKMNEEVKKMEENDENKKTREKYLAIVEELENKYTEIK